MRRWRIATRVCSRSAGRSKMSAAGCVRMSPPPRRCCSPHGCSSTISRWRFCSACRSLSGRARTRWSKRSPTSSATAFARGSRPKGNDRRPPAAGGNAPGPDLGWPSPPPTRQLPKHRQQRDRRRAGPTQMGSGALGPSRRRPPVVYPAPRMRFVPILLLIATTALAQIDETYTAAIRKETTEPRFMTELVDHLPSSTTIPSPLQFHGYIAGAEGKLTYAEDVYRYMRALEAATPRVKVFSIGKTEEGREFIAVAVANEDTIAALDHYRDITRRLADPRKLTDDDAKTLIAQGKPIYYLTGAMHSPETGSPEMLMELAYRLAVEDTPFIRDIRNNVITLITPVLEVDGRDRQVDLWRYREKNPNI